MKKMVFCASLAALLLSGCGLTSRDSSREPAVAPEWSDEWAEYSAVDEKASGSWKSQSAWGNPPSDKGKVVSSPLPGIEEAKPNPVLSRPRFSPAEAPAENHEIVQMDKAVETNSLKPTPSDSTLTPSVKAEVVEPIRPRLVEPTDPSVQPIQPVRSPATVVHADELAAPGIVKSPVTPAPKASMPADVSAPSSAPASGHPVVAPVRPVPAGLSSEEQPIDAPQSLEVEVPAETVDNQETAAPIVAPVPKLDGRIRSPWGDHVLTPGLRADLDAAVLGAVSSGSSEYTATDGTTKFWVEHKGSRGACKVFEVMRGGVASNSVIKDRGEAVFCGS